MLTGKLGDVMKESAQAGLSFVRSRAEEFNIEDDFHEKHDIHIHIPEGAIPKMGPQPGSPWQLLWYQQSPAGQSDMMWL